ncbi:vault protein inter-alpha-trypsin domain protein [Candidatus Vecturithrix granuli]|uniref:Vault protein inter-alpha-trypsin domain protein n=1 Tax=Vecturithrix granuli TaxID=1499967 RepID=A0A081C8T3_VECG1|nr:vault protein inter-alpha-trypsin domain protein [Candidatus Vecturithrix granuli]
MGKITISIYIFGSGYLVHDDRSSSGVETSTQAFPSTSLRERASCTGYHYHIFKRGIMSLWITRHNENEMYRETPVSRQSHWCAKLEFRATFSQETFMEKIWIMLFVIFVVIIFASSPARADGFIIPIPPPDVVRVPPLAIKYHRASVEITDQIARTTVDQVFINEFHRDLEGTYIFPLPKDANITEFAMYMNGERISGELLEKEKARKIYEDIVRQMRDPALLEYLDRNLFKIRVYPIPAHGEKRIQLEYSEVLKNDAGMVRYHYPLDTERFSSRPLQDVRVAVTLRAQAGLKSIYSPSHDVAIDRKDAHYAIISYEDARVVPDKDFILYYTMSEDAVGMNVLTYKQTQQDGYVMVMLSPGYDNAQRDIMPKDIVFVLDTSGSMRQDNKLQQAQEALIYGLKGLRPDDRFGLVTFSTTVHSFDDVLHAGSSEQIEQALQFVKDLRARGGTDIYEALKTALSFFGDDASRPQLVVFLTDGRPTVGLTEYTDILKQVQKHDSKSYRLFTFGVGYDVNTHLLDSLAEQSKAASAYIEPFEDLEVIVSAFFDKIDAPVLSQLAFSISGAGIYDIFPKELPDLFKGSQLLLFGRYRTSGEFPLVLSGTVEGQEQRHTYQIELPRSDLRHDFLPRIWASRKIGYLLDQIRLHGEEPELKEEVIALAKKFGIVTPYTSYLVTEDEELEARRTPERRRPLFYDLSAAPASTGRAASQSAADGLYRMDKGAAPALAPEFTETKEGEVAVRVSKDVNKLKQQTVVAETASQEIRYVETKTFYQIEGVWIDSEYVDGQPVTNILYGSDAYFKVLDTLPALGKYFALGEKLIVCIDDLCLKIGETGISEANDRELSRLLQQIK